MQCAPIYVYDVMTINEISIFQYIIGSWRNCQKEESKPTLQVSFILNGLIVDDLEKSYKLLNRTEL
jgi:hypothetical protein